MKDFDCGKYHWGCHLCGIDDSKEKSSISAQDKLKQHEKECHKGKPVGYWGISFENEPLTIIQK